MSTQLFEINYKGKRARVPSICVEGKTVVSIGNWVRVARVYGEDWIDGEAVQNPALFLRLLKEEALKADIFTFGQRIPDTNPRYSYPFEWDNAAVIPITTFSEWWEKCLPQVSRKNVRRSSKRGVVVKEVHFDDEFVHSLIRMFDQISVKQGRRFAHHGKDFDTVKSDFASMSDRSGFLGAYYGDELIGVIKLVYMGRIASILHIITADAHYDKRPANALIARAVEVCERKRISYLWYGNYTYGNKTNCPVREFKHRNGFVEMRFPRYYVPLTFKGKLTLRLGLHLGLIGILPGSMIAFLVRWRARIVWLVSEVVGVRKRMCGGSPTAGVSEADSETT